MAAGRSSRFGPECKLQTVYRGKPLVRHAADAIIQIGLPSIVVIADPDVEGLLPEFRIVRCCGTQSQSLQAGLSQVRDNAAMIVLGDMPNIDADIIRKIAAAPSPAALWDGTRICPPASIPRALFTRIFSLTGDVGARDLLRSLPDLNRVQVPSHLLKDIDHRRDLDEDLSS
ncbi:NTP transferase domain-containing protein [Paracoccus sp. (in: a-proteobacteria)]|uniref:nucleotidyltransferase family protein n=1 Tax=Paracoccus sp. TaxID=267 RepID=UPI0035AEE701